MLNLLRSQLGARTLVGADAHRDSVLMGVVQYYPYNPFPRWRIQRESPPAVRSAHLGGNSAVLDALGSAERRQREKRRCEAQASPHGDI